MDSSFDNLSHAEKLNRIFIIFGMILVVSFAWIIITYILSDKTRKPKYEIVDIKHPYYKKFQLLNRLEKLEGEHKKKGNALRKEISPDEFERFMRFQRLRQLEEIEEELMKKQFHPRPGKKMTKAAKQRQQQLQKQQKILNQQLYHPQQQKQQQKGQQQAYHPGYYTQYPHGLGYYPPPGYYYQQPYPMTYQQQQQLQKQQKQQQQQQQRQRQQQQQQQRQRQQQQQQPQQQQKTKKKKQKQKQRLASAQPQAKSRPAQTDQQRAQSRGFVPPPQSTRMMSTTRPGAQRGTNVSGLQRRDPGYLNEQVDFGAYPSTRQPSVTQYNQVPYNYTNLVPGGHLK